MQEQIEQDDEELPEGQEQEAPEAQEPEQSDAEREEIEAEARKYGWRPKEDFDKAPDGWVDAARFMEFPSTQVKMLRDTRRELEKRLAEQERARAEDIARVEAANKAAMERVRAQEKAQFETRLAQIQRQKAEAAKSMDLETYDRLAQQEAQLRPPKEPEAERQQPPPVVPPEIDSYRRENDWAQNPALWQQMSQFVDYAMQTGQMRPDAAPADQLAYADRMMRQARPDLFPQAKLTTSRVDGGGLAPRSGKRGKSAADLPADVKKIGADYVKEGIYSSIDEYATDYFAEVSQ